MTDRLVLPSEGIADQLAYILREPISGVLDWLLVLYQFPVNPNESTVWADLTECTFSGYSRVTLTRGTWSVPTVAAGMASSHWGSSPLVFTNGGSAQDVAGFAYIRPGSIVLRAIQELNTPIVLGNGQTLPLWPPYTLTTDTCTP